MEELKVRSDKLRTFKREGAMTVNVLGKLFGRSPFGPLQAHMKKVQECATHLRPFFENMIAGNKEAADAERKNILLLEHEADKVKNAIRDNLPRTSFLPVDRRDLLELLSTMDSIADSAEDAVVVASLKDLPCPDSISAPFMEFLETVEKTVQAAGEVFESLNQLVEAAFSGPTAQKVHEAISEINRLEWESDKTQYRLGKLVLQHEDDLGPINTIMWMRLTQRVAGLANASEKACDRLRLLLMA